MLRVFDPFLDSMPRLKDNSFQRILRLEAKYARYFWSKYFSAVADDLFAREKRKAKHPINASLNYGYGFLYHAIEWQTLASGLDPSIGIVHRVRRSRPNLVCDLIEPLRCIVELTVVRNLDQIHQRKYMAGRFAEMMEEKFIYREKQFRLRSIIRLMTESFIRSLNDKKRFEPFILNARDARI